PQKPAEPLPGSAGFSVHHNHGRAAAPASTHPSSEAMNTPRAGETVTMYGISSTARRTRPRPRMSGIASSRSFSSTTAGMENGSGDHATRTRTTHIHSGADPRTSWVGEYSDTRVTM